LQGKERKLQDNIVTSGESALPFEKRDKAARAGPPKATESAASRSVVQRHARRSRVTTITAAATPPHQVIGQKVTIDGQLTSGGGAHLVGVPVVLYSIDDPTKKVSITTTSTDALGLYQFTLTGSVASIRSYVVRAEGRSVYSRAQSPEVLVTYHQSRIRDTTRIALAPAARARTVFGLLWSEALAMLLILAGEGLLFAGHRVAGVGVQALNLVVIIFAIEVLDGEGVELLEALALVSLLRVVNLSFVVVPMVTLYWLVGIYGVMFIAIISVVAHRKLSRQYLGLRGGPALAILLPFGAVVGVELALIEYRILANPALIPSFSVIWLFELSVVIFIVAIVEELIFRSLLQSELVERSGPIAGIIITSVIFGAMQSGFANYYELLFAFGVGIVFGVAFYKTKSLPFVVTMHAVNNIILFGVLPFFSLLALPF